MIHTDPQKMMAISCSEPKCSSVIWAPVKDTENALRRVDWQWDGLAATCRNH